MAPFKLKFRMGIGSRSTSQDHSDHSDGPNAPLDNQQPQQNATAESSPLLMPLLVRSMRADSQQTIAGSLGTPDEQQPGPSAGLRNAGFVNPAAVVESGDSSAPAAEFNSSAAAAGPPQSPPPSYEHVLEENRRANLDNNNPAGGSRPPPSRPVSVCVNVVENGLATRLNNEQPIDDRRNGNCHSIAMSTTTTPSLDDGSSGGDFPPDGHSNDNRPTTTTAVAVGGHSNNNECTFNDLERSGGRQANAGNSNDLHMCTESHAEDDEQLECTEDDDDWHSHHEHFAHQIVQTPDRVISNKSSKELYKQVAAEWGITCKMSEHCRCMECQSNYFDCEYEENDNHKSDGGLGAGAPMFISEVMHGSACAIL